jgi:hypothetical protein
LSEAKEFFHYCLKKFERERVGFAQVIDEDSELTDAIDGFGEEDGGDKKLVLKPNKNKKNQSKKNQQDDDDEESKSSEESDDNDDDEDDEDILESRWPSTL